MTTLTVGTCYRCSSVLPLSCLPYEVEVADEGRIVRVCDDCMKVLRNRDSGAKTLDRVRTVVQSRPLKPIHE